MFRRYAPIDATIPIYDALFTALAPKTEPPVKAAAPFNPTTPTCPVCSSACTVEKCKVICRSERCVYAIVSTCCEGG